MLETVLVYVCLLVSVATAHFHFNLQPSLFAVQGLGESSLSSLWNVEGVFMFIASVERSIFNL